MNDQVHVNPVTIESDDCGTRLVIDLAGMEGEFPLLRIGCTLSADAALALYEHVDRTLGSWAREGIAARRAVAAGVTLDAYVNEGVPIGDNLDYEAEAELLRDAGDRERKARRENG